MDRDYAKQAMTPEDATESVQETVYGTSEHLHLFDVVLVRVVGSVYSGGSQSPRIAAFSMIAMEDTDGEYSFPDEDGRRVTVVVTTDDHSQ